jgi:hydrogenase maturation protease
MNRPMLVIGYGNELRGDDGVGPCVAGAIAARDLAGVEVIRCHQLVPELAERAAGSRTVIFVDAAADFDDDGVTIRPLEPATSAAGMGHTSDPRWLLALAETLCGRRPAAWLVTVPATNLEFGEGLSPMAARGAVEAEGHVMRLLHAELRSTRRD